MTKRIYVIVGVVVLLIVFNAVTYTVPETAQVVVTQFGSPIAVVKEPGLHFKKPLIHQINYFDDRLLEWDGNPTQVPTRDKRYIWVDAFARWKIEDPLKFFQTVTNEVSAHARLDDIVNSSVRNQISNNVLIEAIRTSNRPMMSAIKSVGVGEGSTQAGGKENLPGVQKIDEGRSKIEEMILEESGPSTLEYGIKLVDIKIKRLNYVEKVREAVYQRMVAERERIAAKFRSEGEGEMMDIRGQKEKEEKRILSEAYRQAQEIKGKADAEAVKVYAKAYSKDPEFYSFVKTLETYRKTLGEKSRLILSTDSDYFKYLKSAVKNKD